MPLENLEEEGLPKNPDLRIAQLRFLLSLPEHRGDAAVRDELMAAVRDNSEARRRVSGLGRRGCLAGGVGLRAQGRVGVAAWSVAVGALACVAFTRDSACIDPLPPPLPLPHQPPRANRGAPVPGPGRGGRRGRP